jgi:hypothetical protein
VKQRPIRERLPWALAGCLAALGLAGTFLLQHRETFERGNHLFRDGRVDRAEEIYRTHAESELATETAAYNLGTALLALGAPEAEEYLRIAAVGGDSAAAQRGYYNLGRDLLTRLDDAATSGSALQLLTGAVDNNRAALRLDPRDERARWNLALAQRKLDSLALLLELEDEEAPQEGVERPDDESGMILPRVARLGLPSGSEREALAGDDPGALSDADARGLIETVDRSVERLIRGFLWSHRPDVRPWEEPYPGGNW